MECEEPMSVIGKPFPSRTIVLNDFNRVRAGYNRRRNVRTQNYMEMFYNPKRRHGSCGGDLSPVEFENSASCGRVG